MRMPGSTCRRWNIISTMRTNTTATTTSSLFNPTTLCVPRNCRFDLYLQSPGWYETVVTAAYQDDSDVLNVNNVRYSTKVSPYYDEEDYYRKAGIDRHALKLKPVPDTGKS